MNYKFQRARVLLKWGRESERGLDPKGCYEEK